LGYFVMLNEYFLTYFVILLPFQMTRIWISSALYTKNLAGVSHSSFKAFNT